MRPADHAARSPLGARIVVAFGCWVVLAYGVLFVLLALRHGSRAFEAFGHFCTFLPMILIEFSGQPSLWAFGERLVLPTSSFYALSPLGLACTVLLHLGCAVSATSVGVAVLGRLSTRKE